MEIVVFPSIYEVFNLSILEAIIAGKIIFAHKTKWAVDILGENYPLYYDSFDKNGLVDVIKRYEKMSMLEKEKLIKDNHKKINKFSIKKTINMYKNYRFDMSFELKSPEYGVRLI
jgi:glycosyltransferase involved in cell wall biosynthesis